jgi:hypothetical protein
MPLQMDQDLVHGKRRKSSRRTKMTKKVKGKIEADP